MKLDDRKMTILKTIIQNYLETGEPVGSRTISKSSGLNLSSATIRNEMSDLEEMGLILQPHTSAGRIPSDKGYRLYVDEMMKEKEQEITEMKDFLIQKVDRVELLLKQMAQLLAANTNYATMIAGPNPNGNKLKYLQISKVDETKLLIIVVSEGNIIKNTIVDMDLELSDNDVLKMNILLNSNLAGLTIEQINLNIISKMKEEAGEFCEVVELVLEAVADAIRSDADPMIYTSGATNIFKYPELTVGESASGLIHALEEKKELAHFLSENAGDAENTGIQVYIGGETSVQTMKDCSVVTTHYELGNGLQGTIGIIGPKRMDYEKVFSTLKTLTEQLDAIYKKQ